jgi:hypothetical protein
MPGLLGLDRPGRRVSGSFRSGPFASLAAARAAHPQRLAARFVPLTAQSCGSPDMVKSGILPMHAYTVTAVEEMNGQRLVTVRNPALYRPELDDPKVQDQFAKDPMYGPPVQVLRDNKLSARDVKWGAFTLPYAEFEKVFSFAFTAPVNG